MFNAPNRSTCPSTGLSESGTSIKLVGRWVTPKGMPTSVAHRMAHKIAPGTLTRLQGYRQEQAAQRHQRAGGEKVAEHQRVGFRIGQHQPGIAKAEDGDKQADGGGEPRA